MLRKIPSLLKVVETTQHCGRNLYDVSDDEDKEVQATRTPKPEMELGEERVMKALTSLKTTLQFKPCKYSGQLDLDELMDYIFEKEKYFEYESIVEEKKVKIIRKVERTYILLVEEFVVGQEKERETEKTTTSIYFYSKNLIHFEL